MFIGSVKNTSFNTLGIIFISLILLLAPLSTLYAQPSTPPPPPGGGSGSGLGGAGRDNLTIGDIFARLSEIFNLFIPFLILVGTVLFLWGVTRYILAGGDEKQIEEARNIIIYGIISLACMIAVWAFVNILASAITGTTNPPGLPGIDIKPFL